MVDPLSVGAGWFVAVVNGATCREQLLSTLAPGLEYLADWIDQDTPDTACTKQLCTNSQFSVCNPASSSVPTESMVGRLKGPHFVPHSLLYSRVKQKQGALRSETQSPVVL